MNILLIQKDTLGVVTKSDRNITLPRLLKSVGSAGELHPSAIRTVMGSLGFLAYYWDYWEFSPFTPFRLRSASMDRLDPTKMGQVSNIIGKALADRFARDISGAVFTHTYEAALAIRKMVHVGKRPDMYCDTLSKQFSMEAKGFSAAGLSDTAMSEHKLQAQSGPIPVHFAIASVSYGLYSRPKCKYYDPVFDGAEYEKELNSIMARLRLAELISEISNDIRSESSVNIGGSTYERYVITQEGGFKVSWLLDKRVRAFVSGDILSFEKTERLDDEGLFIDSDGVGIELG